jgi:hypothetical protein
VASGRSIGGDRGESPTQRDGIPWNRRMSRRIL